jgi:predicted nucleotidyltransferase
MKTVNSKNELITTLLSEKERIRSFGVKELDLFGSFVKENMINPESDIDLLVEFEEGKKNFDNFIDLNYFLEDITGRKVELVTRRSLSPFIGPHIIKEMENVGI